MNQTYPKISIITPSYNQGQYIEETILSVIGQNYPNLEYIIIDGGSTDNTVEIIKKYEKHLAYWASEPDNGQAHAINKGFAIATGDILAWLNSDDMYMPKILNYVAENINTQKPEFLFGDCIHFDENKTTVFKNQYLDLHNIVELAYIDYIDQPSSFWTKRAWDKVGQLNEASHYVFDWEWFIRAQRAGVNYIPTSKYLSMYRIHSMHKTGSGGNERMVEIMGIFAKYLSTDMYELSKKLYDNRDKIIMAKRRIDFFRLWRLRKIILKILFPKIYSYPTDLSSAISMMLGFSIL